MIVDLVQDIVCPWCRIGAHHLKTALAQWHGSPVRVRVHPFLLDPSVPREGVPYRAHLARKFGSDRAVLDAWEKLAAAGTAMGVTFAFDRIAKAVDTRSAHLLVGLAEESRQLAVLDALHDALFRDGRDVGDTEVLVAIGGAHGIDGERVRAAMDDPGMRRAVDVEHQAAVRRGVTGVPFFVFDDRFAAVGAQPPDRLLSAMERAAKA